MGRGESDTFDVNQIERSALDDGDLVELKNAAQWSEEFGIVILDADGWQGRDPLPFETPISRAEFERRMNISTIGSRAAFVKEELLRPTGKSLDELSPLARSMAEMWDGGYTFKQIAAQHQTDASNVRKVLAYEGYLR